MWQGEEERPGPHRRSWGLGNGVRGGGRGRGDAGEEIRRRSSPARRQGSAPVPIQIGTRGSGGGLGGATLEELQGEGGGAWARCAS